MLNAHHGVDNGLAYILRCLTQVIPVTSRRNDKSVDFGFLKKLNSETIIIANIFIEILNLFYFDSNFRLNNVGLRYFSLLLAKRVAKRVYEYKECK